MGKDYIFFTYDLNGYTGGPSYVRNKKIWLEKQGWHVIAFDCNEIYSSIYPISFPDLLSFQDNRIEYLKYHPSWFSHKKREEILLNLINRISPIKEDVVIESNGIILAEWGELISQRINAKHLVFLIAENIVINDDCIFDFLYFKYKREELYTINGEACKLLFSRYLNVLNDDLRFWNAMSITVPQDTLFREFEDISSKDILICHFGRKKSYFPYMISEISKFVSSYPNLNFSIVFMGCPFLDEQFKNVLMRNKNLKVYLFESRFPIPQIIFKKSNVILANAGCASIAYRAGALTISMNVNTCRPLGILGYTTNQIIYSSEEFPDSELELSTILKDILINNKYNGDPCIPMRSRIHGYEYQMSCINHNKIYYNYILSIKELSKFKHKIVSVLFKLGLDKFYINIKSFFKVI